MSTILLYKKNNIINSSGGAERIMITYANELANRGHNVILATRDEKKGKLFFELNQNVNFMHFDFKFSRIRRFIGKILSKLNINKFPYFNRELQVSSMIDDFCKKINPDVIILCGMQELVDFAYKREYRCPMILMMHGHPKVYFKKKRIKLYNKYINNADTIQILLDSFAEGLPDCYNGKVVCIGNPVCIDNSKSFTKKNIIIYVARITPDKQQHLLIEAFNKIANNYPDWQVHMYGCINDAKYLDKCNNLINSYKLNGQIKFMGTTDNVSEVIGTAKICAFPSAHEGFSLAQIEAMSMGLPVIGFDYSTGVNELINNGKDGFLVRDINEFAEKLELLINDANLRQNMGNNATNIGYKYSMTNIINQWENLINNVINISI